MTSYPCPACLTEANLDTGCPGCGRAPDPVAAEVIQLDGQIAELDLMLADARTDVERAQTRYTALAEQMRSARSRRGRLAAQVWASVHAPAAAAPVAQAPAAVASARPETTTQTVKNVLFVLGGILLGIAAIVFTAFAWGTFGMAGKAAILGVITAATLSVPLVALRRSLNGTAETFAALGLLLVALDGYAVWRVDLGGIQHAMPGSTYAGVVSAITAATSVAYGRLTRLTAPGVMGFAAAQPVLPLVFAPLIDGRAAGLSLVLAAVAAADLAVARSRGPLPRALTTIGYATSLTLAHGYAFAALYRAQGTGAVAIAAGVTLLAGALVPAGALVLAGTPLRPGPLWLTGAAAWCTGLVALVGLVVCVRLAPGHARPLTVGLIAVLGFATALVEVRGRGAVWRGMLIGSAAAGGVAGLVVAAYVAESAFGRATENVAVEVILLGAAAVAVSRRTQPLLAAMTAVGTTVALALAIPAGFAAYWLPPVTDLAAMAVLLTALLWPRPAVGVRAFIGAGVAILAVHAVFDAAQRPGLLAYTLGGMVVSAAATAVAGWWRDRIAGAAATAVAVPLTVALGAAVAWTVHSVVIHAMALTAAALPAAVWAVRRWYTRPADLSARVTILLAVFIAVVEPGDAWTKSVYAAGGAVALAVLPRTGPVERIAGWVALAGALVLARPPLLILVQPYAWPFSGVSTQTAGLADVLAIAVLTATLWTVRPVLYCAITAPIALGLVHFGLTWPWLPLVLLVSGLALVAYAVSRTPWCAAVGLVLAGSGLTGLSVEHWSFITGLALVCAASAGLALLTPVRLPAWIVFAAAWLGLAVVSAQAAGLTDRGVAFTVLSAAAALLLASVFAVRLPGVRVLEIPAHLAALGVIATVPSAARLSEACLVWGVAAGLTAVGRRCAPWRGEWILRLGVTGALEIVALWALLISRDVRAVEAYSLPLAAVALLVGALALRRDPALTSWVGYGPALVAGFGPSLAVILPVEGDPLRRLGLGIAALVVVIAGAVRRRQAPVVIGGAVLIVVALHELVQVWSSLPLWLPIGAGGAILVGLAITYERRLRDLRALRSRLSSYT